MWTGIFILVLAVILLAGVELGGKYLLVWLGKQDTWWSPLRIRPTSGQFYYIALGDPNGTTSRVVASVPGYKLITLPDGTCKFVSLNGAPPSPLGWLETELGVTYVGLYRSFYKRTRRYEALEPKKDGKGWDIVPKIRDDHLFFFQTEMVAVVDEAETIGNFPINITIPFTARIVNPIRSEFFAGKWELQITSAVRAAARDYIETRTYEELLHERDVDGAMNLIAAILAANPSLDPFGVEIVTPRIEKFDLASATADYANATRAKEIERLKADAKTEEARGITTLGDARAATIRAAGKAYKEDGVEGQAIADAIREAKPSVVSIGGAGTGVVIPLPDKK